MKSAGLILGTAIGVAFVVLSIVQCSRQWEACKAANGTPVYEYKNMPSCWGADGRRIFP